MIVLLIFVIVIVFLIWRLIVEFGKFDVPIKKAKEQKKVLLNENNELHEKWNPKIITDDLAIKVKTMYKSSIILLYQIGFFKLFDEFIADNVEKGVNVNSLKIKYVYPYYSNMQTNEAITNRFNIITYVEYSYYDKNNKEINRNGYFETVGADSKTTKISNVNLDDLKNYSIDIENVNKTKRQFLEILNNASINDIINEYEADSVTIMSNDLQISSYDKDIKLHKNAKKTAIIGGIIVGAAACKAIDKAKTKKQ